ASELGMPWSIVRGIGVIARAIGLVGHIREELQNPLAREIKTRAEEEATSHRRGAPRGCIVGSRLCRSRVSLRPGPGCRTMTEMGLLTVQSVARRPHPVIF